MRSNNRLAIGGEEEGMPIMALTVTNWDCPRQALKRAEFETQFRGQLRSQVQLGNEEKGYTRIRALFVGVHSSRSCGIRGYCSGGL